MHDANCIIPKQADMLTAYHYTHFSFEDHKSCSQHAQRKHAGYQHSSISALIDHKEKQTREVNERVRIKYGIRNGKGIDKEVFEQQKHFRCRCASRDPKKHGYHVYEDLNNADYGVHTVNSNAEKILGDKCYHNLENLPVKPAVVDVLVPPKVAEEVVKACKEPVITMVRMQPSDRS